MKRVNNQNQYSILARHASENRRNKNTFNAIRIRHAFAFLITAAVLLRSNFLMGVKAADGDLDTSFGGSGKVITDFFGFSDVGHGVAIQPDGKIIVPGRVVVDATQTAVFGIVRYNSNGSLDAGFGSGGKVTTSFYGISDGAFAVAVQSDGKIVAVGGAFSSPSNNDCAIARYNSDGNLDGSFGNGGKVSLDFADGVNDEAQDLVIQPDGKIVVAVSVLTSPDNDFIVARFNSDGTIDGNFGIGGVTTTDFYGLEDSAYTVALQADGKIIAGGPISNYQDINDFGLARYNSNGTPDVTFGSGGKVDTDFTGFSDAVLGIAIQNDGKIIASGSAVGNFSFDVALARYNADGTLDNSFGIGGKVTTDFFGYTDSATSVVVACDGKIVVAGRASTVNTSDMCVVRYLSDGTLDPSFGAGGKVTVDFVGHQEAAYGIGLQSDGKIVIGGYTHSGVSFDTLEFAAARLNSSGNSGCGASAACPQPHGYWKNNPASWPVDSLTLGGQTYMKSELFAIVKMSSQTDASVILARQVIAAKLNIANGSDPAPINATISHADSLLSGYGGKLPFKVKPSSTSGQQMTADAVILNNYNNGLMTPGCNP